MVTVQAQIEDDVMWKHRGDTQHQVGEKWEIWLVLWLMLMLIMLCFYNCIMSGGLVYTFYK